MYQLFPPQSTELRSLDTHGFSRSGYYALRSGSTVHIIKCLRGAGDTLRLSPHIYRHVFQIIVCSNPPVFSLRKDRPSQSSSVYEDGEQYTWEDFLVVCKFIDAKHRWHMTMRGFPRGHLRSFRGRPCAQSRVIQQNSLADSPTPAVSRTHRPTLRPRQANTAERTTHPAPRAWP